MRVLGVQFDARPGAVAENAAKVEQLLQSASPGAADLVVLPEMALSGYVFESLEHVQPYLESPYADDSRTLDLCRAIAARLHCYVVAGFPERAAKGAADALDGAPPHDARSELRQNQASSYAPRVLGEAYNAAMLVGRDGALLKVFRKHFLYETDTTWADEGPGFQTVALPGLGRVCVAVCMDMNPYQLDSDFQRYELAYFCDREKVDLLVVPMNWLMPEDEEPGADDRPSLGTINYWVTRSLPLWVPGMSQPSSAGHCTTLVACNRMGTERGLTFAGSSSVITFVAAGQASLEKAIGKREEGVVDVVLGAE
ncbi:hypothetical protein MSPP1_004175 [Malassezia sp. CBS 17886]|nr:hypothetical protein MSPP1_004175 [Malassezia sp. CBS 17886]